MLLRTMTTLVLAAFLAACGSDGSIPVTPVVAINDPPPAAGDSSPFMHFEGVWQGTIMPDDTMTSRPAILIVNGWGEFRLLTGDAQFVGFPHRTLSELEGELAGIQSPGSTWSDGSTVSAFTIDGAIDEDDFIDATYSGATGSGTMVLSPVLAIESSSIGAALGTWMLFDDDQNYVATFDFDVINQWEAIVSGTHSNGCIYSGSVESWTSVNSYDVWALDVSNCPMVGGVDLNGEYAGSAVRIDVANDGSDELALVIGMSSEDIQLTYFLYRP